MKKKLNKRLLTKKMDKLFGEIIRSQGVCEKCNSHQNLQCAHVVSRRHLRTRWDLDNALCLCKRCHIFWQHKEPHEFVRWFDNKFGGKLYEELKKRANSLEKVDYEEKYKFLKDIHERL
jgi:5-methylcytosine-specific restriction endonuclease McrA